MKLPAIINGKLRYVNVQLIDSTSPDTLSVTPSTTGEPASSEPFSEPAVTNPQTVADQRDELASDLLAILGGTTREMRLPPLNLKYQDVVMQKLVTYLGERDQRILNHGINLGMAEHERA